MCKKWNHPDCEIEFGTDPEYKEAAIEIKRQEELENEQIMKESGGQNEQMKNAEDLAVVQQPLTKMIITTETPPKPRESDVEEALYYCLQCRETLKQPAKKTTMSKKNAAKAKAAANKKNALAKAAAQQNNKDKKQIVSSPSRATSSKPDEVLKQGTATPTSQLPNGTAVKKLSTKQFTAK